MSNELDLDRVEAREMVFLAARSAMQARMAELVFEHTLTPADEVAILGDMISRVGYGLRSRNRARSGS